MALTAQATEYLDRFYAQPWPAFDTVTAAAYRRAADGVIRQLDSDPLVRVSNRSTS